MLRAAAVSGVVAAAALGAVAAQSSAGPARDMANQVSDGPGGHTAIVLASGHNTLDW
jgi:hypothetical protein